METLKPKINEKLTDLIERELRGKKGQEVMIELWPELMVEFWNPLFVEIENHLNLIKHGSHRP